MIVMNDELKNVIISLGIVTGLDEEDEESINQVLNSYSDEINQKLDSLNENNHILKNLIMEKEETDEFSFF